MSTSTIRRPIRTHRAAVLELPDMMASAVALSHDMLAAASRAALAMGRGVVFDACPLRPEQKLPRDLSLLVVPGLGCASPAEVARALGKRPIPWAIRTISRAHERGARIVASCASVFLLAETGLLDGRTATTSWFLAPELAARHPAIRVASERVLVESGRCLTGGAALAHADAMLAAIEILAGPSTADTCARYLLLDRRQSQRPYMVLSALIAGDGQLAAAERWVRMNIRRQFAIAELARAVALGPRTFARRLHRATGLAPVKFVQRVRVDAARRLLEGGMSFESAAAEVGYSDATALRRVFRRHARAPRS